MSFPVAAWASALFFLFALILLRRFKPQINRVDLTSFGNISCGLTLLAIFSLSKVYFQLGVLASLPFISETTFFDVVFAIGMISGTIFLLHGVSSFMPLAKLDRKEAGSHLRRVEFIRRVEQLTAVENRLDILLERTMEEMLDAFGFETGSVYKYSPRTNSSKYVSSAGREIMTSEHLMNLRFEVSSLPQAFITTASPAESVHIQLPENIAQPEFILPIIVDNEPAGFFLMWAGEQQFIERDELQNLKIAADIIARKIISDRNRLQYDFLVNCERLRRQIQAGLKTGQAIGEGLAQLTGYLAGHLTFSLASLTIIDATDGSLRRLSVGPNNALLDEKGLSLSERMGITNHVSRIGRPVRVTNYSDHSQTLYEDILENARMNSALAIPVLDSNQVVAVLMLASEQPGCFSRSDSTLLAHATSGLAQLVRYEDQRSAAADRESRFSKVTELMQAGLASETYDDIANLSAKLIAGEFKNSQVRISLIEDEASFLKSIALAAKPEIAAQVPVDGRMILSLMPCHTEVIASGQALVVKQNDPDSAAMPESETTQALNSSLNSAMIVPITVDNRVQGLISVAGMNAIGFDAADISFIEAIAEVMTITGTQVETKTPVKTANRVSLLQTLVENQTARGQVRSSLTGILGSIEMLRATADHNPDSLNRYLSIIDSSAQKLNECLTEDNSLLEENILG